MLGTGTGQVRTPRGEEFRPYSDVCSQDERMASVVMSPQPAPTFQWRAHPARRRIGVACLALLVTAVAAGLVAIIMQSTLWLLITPLIVLLPSARFFLPSRYHLDDSGLTASCAGFTQRIAWSQVRRFVVDDRRGFLSTRAHSSTLDLFRGVSLLFDEDEGEIRRQIEAYLPASVQTVDTQQPGGGA